jgi:5-methylcytosine-specific restriction endonuclease McrA
MPSKPPTFRAPLPPIATLQITKPRENFYGTKAWKDLRLLALRRDRYQCVMPNCTTPGRGAGGRLTVDHIIERRKGGADVLSNLRTLCTTCDADRHGNRGGGPGG